MNSQEIKVIFLILLKPITDPNPNESLRDFEEPRTVSRNEMPMNTQNVH
jgi:hypothetical protein